MDKNTLVFQPLIQGAFASTDEEDDDEISAISAKLPNKCKKFASSFSE